MRSKRYLWNAGIFVFRGDTLLAALRRLTPAIAAGLVPVLVVSIWDDIRPLRALPKFLGQLAGAAIAILGHAASAAAPSLEVLVAFRMVAGFGAGMLIAAGVIQLLGLQGREAAMLLVFGALPPAVLNFLFAERYKQEPERVASIVLIGNLAALVFLPLALALAL